ncbi:6-bladed beta-propeller [Longimonas halophila]|uniref:6-bladed beta-propeller n=1 Tax=Longimonas halophila TaxID=1469170 RepID=UPI001596EE85|nr:6-bladed beta-propeller [Longimonas halophila]
MLLGSAYEAAGQPQEQPLEVRHTIPSDDSFIGQVRDVKVSDDAVFVADYQRNEVLVYTRDGTLLRQIGEGEGEGPGEFRYIGHIDVSGDSMLVSNNGNRRFDLFHREGQFIETYAQKYVYASDFTLTEDGSIYGSAFKRSGSNRLISRMGRDGELRERFGDMYFEDEEIIFLASNGWIHEEHGQFVYVSEHYETVRVFEDTTETHRFDIYNEVLDDALANNKDLSQFRPAVDQRFPFQPYIRAAAVHDDIVYAAFQEPEQIRILAYTIDGEPYGNYVYDGIQRPDDLVVRAMDVDDEGIYLGLEDDIPKVLVFAHPDK